MYTIDIIPICSRIIFPQKFNESISDIFLVSKECCIQDVDYSHGDRNVVRIVLI